jgi:hypothetical protein
MTKCGVQPDQAYTAIQVFESESKRQAELFVNVVHQVLDQEVETSRELMTIISWPRQKRCKIH